VFCGGCGLIRLIHPEKYATGLTFREICGFSKQPV